MLTIDQNTKCPLQGLTKTARLKEAAQTLDTPFEKAFANLAYAVIKDKSPRILDHLIGFQLLERDEDDTKAVGVFGAVLGKQLVFVPVFFLNGQLKGHELLYLADKDRFVPLKEKWVNYLLGRRAPELGRGIQPLEVHEVAAAPPSIDRLIWPGGAVGPYVFQKSSSADWFAPFLPVYGDLTVNRPSVLDQDWLVDLERILSSSLPLCKAACELASRVPGVKAAFDRFHGRDFLSRCLQTLREKVAAEPEPARTVVRRTVRLVQEEYHLPLSDDEDLVKRHIRDGLTIIDERPDEETSSAYEESLRYRVTNPTSSGIYRAVTPDGHVKRVLCLVKPLAWSSRQPGMIVVDLDDNVYDILPAHRVFVLQEEGTLEDGVSPAGDKAMPSWFDELPDSGMPSEREFSPKFVGDARDGDVIFVTPSGESAGPLYLTGKMGDSWRACWAWYAEAPQRVPERYTYSERPEIEQVTIRDVPAFRMDRCCLLVPRAAKVLRVRRGNPNVGGNVPLEKPASFADPVQLAALAYRGTDRLTLRRDGSSISINRGPFVPEKDAIVELVFRHGLREKAACELLARTQGPKPRHFRIKYAQGYPQLGGDVGVPFPDPNVAVGPGQIPAFPSQDVTMPVEGLLTTGNEALYDVRPEAMADPSVLQTAQMAAQTGQKELFDVSVLSSLLRSVRGVENVDEYLGPLLRALDRLGRLYFIFLWRRDDFADRYGKADMPELEGALRNAFDVLGDLVLFLQEADVRPLDSLDDMSDSLENIANIG